MNEPKHTPGPWSYSPPFDDGSMLQSSWQPAIIGRFEPASDGSEYRRLVEICAFEFRMTPSEADGRLMAAAPELLQALKEVIAIPFLAKSIERVAASTSADEIEEFVRVISIARAAIAKAEGGSHVY